MATQRHSEEFQRKMASRHFRDHKSKTCFKLNSSVSEITIDEFKKRGCKVSVESGTRHFVIESDVPFKNLVTKDEWKKERNAFLGGCGLYLLIKGGGLGVCFIAIYSGMGVITAVIWFWGWLCISGAALPDTKSKEKIQGITLGLALFALGFIMYAVKK
jgi:hypothetical protein